jgi:hypothetical protein
MWCWLFSANLCGAGYLMVIHAVLLCVLHSSAVSVYMMPVLIYCTVHVMLAYEVLFL